MTWLGRDKPLKHSKYTQWGIPSARMVTRPWRGKQTQTTAKLGFSWEFVFQLGRQKCKKRESQKNMKKTMTSNIGKLYLLHYLHKQCREVIWGSCVDAAMVDCSHKLDFDRTLLGRADRRVRKLLAEGRSPLLINSKAMVVYTCTLALGRLRWRDGCKFKARSRPTTWWGGSHREWLLFSVEFCGR